MNDIEKIINEAKEGIITLKDFYTEDVFNYLYTGILCNIFFSVLVFVLLLISSRIVIKYVKEEFNNEFEYYLIKVACALVCWVPFGVFLSSVYDFILINLAPKTYITREIINMFGN